MTKIKVSEVPKRVLDYLVAITCGDYGPSGYYNNLEGVYYKEPPHYCTDPGLAYPFIEEEKIGVLFDSTNQWRASTYSSGSYGISSTGNTPLIAAMRCYVVSKLGEVVEVPDELL